MLKKLPLLFVLALASLLALDLSVAGSQSVFIAPVPVSDPQPFSTNWQGNPALAVDGLSNPYIAWVDVGTPHGVLFRRSADQGASFGPITMVTGQATYDVSEPTLAVGMAGTIHVAWEDGRNEPGPGIYYARSDDGGATFSINQRAGRSPACVCGAWTPTIATQGTDIFISFRGLACFELVYPPAGVFFVRSRDGGATFEPQVRVDDAGCGQTVQGGFAPAMTRDANGNIYVAWVDDRSPLSVRLARSSDGISFNPSAIVAPLNDTLRRDLVALRALSVAAGRNGEIYTAWMDSNCRPPCEGAVFNIYFARSADGGQTFSPPKQLTSATSATSTSSDWAAAPTLSVGPQGEIGFTWFQSSTTLFAYSTDRGENFSTPVQVGAAYQWPSHTVDQMGLAHVAWWGIFGSEGRVAYSRSTGALVLPAVILVHGWRGGCDNPSTQEREGTFSYLEPWLEQQLGLPDNRVRCFDPPYGNPFADGRWGYRDQDGGVNAALQLTQFIDKFKQELGLGGKDRIDIVAHSFGGLVSRYYIERLRHDVNVRRLAMLGTPNWGVPYLADWCWFFGRIGGILPGRQADEACRDESDRSDFLNELNGSYSPPFTSYQVYAGTGGTGVRGLLTLEPTAENDCLVLVDSARGIGFPLAEVRAIHTGGIWFRVFCPTTGIPGLTQEGSPALPLLLEFLRAPSGASVASVSQASVVSQGSPELAAPVLALGVMDTVLQGETDAYAVQIDSSAQAAVFTILWDGGESTPGLSLSLQRPDGSVVNPADPGVVHESALGDLTEFSGETYAMEPPPPGTWTVSVNGVAVGDAGQTYLALVSLQSPIRLIVTSDATTYSPGDSAVIHAQLTEGTTAVLGATVGATFTLPDSSTAQVSLVDDGTNGDTTPGDGVYTGTFGLTQCGDHAVAVAATGTASGGPFRRSAMRVLSVRVAGDAAGDPCNPDDDGDGFFDVTELHAVTNPLLFCSADATPNNEDPDARPTDFNDDRAVTGADLSAIAGAIGQTVPPAPVRKDIAPDPAGDNAVTGADLSRVAGVIGTAC